MKNVVRYIIGYFVGIFIFILLIPFGLYELSINDPIFQVPLSQFSLFRSIVCLPFLITGLFFMCWSNIYLFKKGKGGPTDGFNIAISPRTKKLVVTGPYSYCRNPMVFGAFSLYFAIGIFMYSLLCLLSLIIFLLFGVFYLKHTEEKRLLKDFGQIYIEYKKQVPMIFPRKQKSRACSEA